MRHRFTQLWILLLCCAFTVATFAQNANSTIKGTVQDTTGAVVPGATVNLTNVGTNQTIATTSSGNGFYTFTNLAPANYKVSVTAQGFAQWVGVLTLRVSQAAEVDPKLTAASVTTKVTVRDVTPIIDRVNPTISDVKNATAIETIPVANRSILNVLAFSPGVVAGSYGGSGAGNTRINGLPPGSADFLVDGQSMTNRNSNELQTNPQPSPTFQEVKVITANGDAQYATPGVVELVTKSGTNHFHGQIFELNQNNHLQAKTYNNAKAVPYLQHNEYGFQIGGPVWLPKVYNGRNKTFFFFDAERIQQNGNAVQRAFLPSTSELQGNLSDLVVNKTGTPITVYDPTTTSAGAPYSRTQISYNGSPNVIAPNRLNAVTQRVFGLTPVAGLTPYFYRPNVPGAQIWNGQPNFIAAQPTTTDNHLYTAKVDQLFGPNRLAMRYTYTDSKSVQPHYYSLEEPNLAEAGGHNGSLTFTEVISPRAINVAHVGIQYYNHQHSGPIQIPNVSGSLGLPNYQNLPYWPQFYYDSYNGTDSYWTGIDRGNPKDYPDQTISASDQFSYNRGNHQMLFGFEFNNYRVTTNESGQPGGNYNTTGYFTALQDPAKPDGTPVAGSGSGLADFLLGDMNMVRVPVYPTYHTRQSQYAGYAQDDWRVSQKLTLNLGVRYVYYTAFSDASGLAATFNPNIAGGMVIYQGSGALPAYTSQEVYTAYQNQGLPIESAAAAHYPLSLFNMPKNNWEPRLGFAYQLDSKTVLRGGYGIYHFADPLIDFQQATRSNPPFSYAATLFPGELPNGTVPNGAAFEMEFPYAQAQYGGTYPPTPTPGNQYMLGSPTFVINPADEAASISQGGGFPMRFLDPNYKTATVQEYNLTLSRELPWNTGFQLSYIGNHSTNLMMLDDINTEIPRLLCTPQPGCEASHPERRMYPNFGSGIVEYGYDGYANTNELQAQLQHTFGSDLTVQSYFTWGHYLTTSEFGNFNTPPPGGTGGGNPGAATNTIIPAALTPGYSTGTIGSGAPKSERIRAVYSNDPTLPTKTFQFNAHYQFPFGKGQRFLGNAHGFLNALVSGYNLSTFFLWHSGFYFAPYFGTGPVTSGGQSINLAPGKNGILPPSQRKATRWFDASIYDPSKGQPYAGQTYIKGTNPLLGDFRNNVPANYMTGPGYNRLDATIYKLTPIWRDLTLDFEAQFLNVYNHQNLSTPTTSGNITKVAGGVCVNGDCPRTIQLQAKVLF